jgi:starch phosphorylase
LQIIYTINERFLKQIKQEFPGDTDRLRRMSIIQEGGEKQVRMGNLAVIGSSRVNGVSALHSDLIKANLFSDFAEREPSKFTNQTNGVTPRRWLLKCNPELASLISDNIGSGWITDLDQLQGLTAFADNLSFQGEWRAIKQKNKQRLADKLLAQHQITLEPSFMLDSHVKRIHEYKRQLLNILHVMSLYIGYSNGTLECDVPRTFLFSGKAAPGYDRAKEIIHLICSVAKVVEADPRMKGKLSVVFVPNYNVSWAESIIPATEVSEQVSTAGMEASGTGNMKFALNGALTVGTLDGANIEIRDAVGEENIFIFGLTADEVESTRRAGYSPRDMHYREAPERAALDALQSGIFSPEEPQRFRGLVDDLLNTDYYLVLADFLSYQSCHKAICEAYTNQQEWTRRSIYNVARMGVFSSDRTIAGYAREIWGIEPDLAPG